MKKLIKLSDTQYIVVSDEQIMIGDYFVDTNGHPYLYTKRDFLPDSSRGDKKLLASTQTIEGVPTIPLHEVEELLGIVNLEKVAEWNIELVNGEVIIKN